ncbi:hypothetical protein [Halotia branconii]|uniref:WD repeat-containing protein n=1 Tax=Halotia branconii CENA392 TaxID=1539056 RepID=A0AAJ6NTA9_9CYAN|nr:hypothetical protein [Halotia branconii]WGV26227.1 hypothetical protein QI031_01555 [Halotia branconii CENA392]
MMNLSNQQDHLANSTAAMKRLSRAIMLADGEFSLILACCNSVKTQQQVLSSLKKSSSADIQEIIICPTAETLYTTIINTIGDSQPEALIVQGLESVTAINQLLLSTNLMRNEFRKNCHFTLVLWVNDEILSKLVWLAPDFKNWAASTIRFDVAYQHSIESPALSA